MVKLSDKTKQAIFTHLFKQENQKINDLFEFAHRIPSGNPDEKLKDLTLYQEVTRDLFGSIDEYIKANHEDDRFKRGIISFGVNELEYGYYPFFKRFFKGIVKKETFSDSFPYESKGFFIDQPRTTYLEEIEHLIPNIRTTLYSRKEINTEFLFRSKVIGELINHPEERVNFHFRKNAQESFPKDLSMIASMYEDIQLGIHVFRYNHDTILRLSYDIFPIQNGISSCNPQYANSYRKLEPRVKSMLDHAFTKLNSFKINNFTKNADKREYLQSFYCMTKTMYNYLNTLKDIKEIEKYDESVYDDILNKVNDKNLIPVLKNIHEKVNSKHTDKINLTLLKDLVKKAI